MNLNLFAVYVIPPALALAAIVTIVNVVLQRARLLRELSGVDDVLARIRDGDRASPLVRTIREHIVPAKTSLSGLIVLSRPLPDVRREYAEDQVANHWSFWVGNLLTGVALLFTFILIGIVMTTDVSGAIRESTNADAAASAHLSSAVNALGGKFYISATGIGGSVFALFAASKARADVYRRAEHPAPALAAAFTSLEAEQVRAQELELELWREDLAARAAQHAEIAGQLTLLNTRMDRLQSIEVSVKELGAEVSANLKNVMKEAMGEQLVLILRDTMADVDRIATTVQTNLTTAFGEQLRGLTTELQQALGAVQRAVEGQGQGHLEQILDKLQNTVSGGFDRESNKMAAALESFAAVVPVLEQQLKAMTTAVAAESRQHAEEAARVSGTVLDRMTSLVEALAAQQDAGAQALDRMVAAAEQGAGVLAQRLASTSETVVSGILSASRAEMGHRDHTPPGCGGDRLPVRGVRRARRARIHRDHCGLGRADKRGHHPTFGAPVHGECVRSGQGWRRGHPDRVPELRPGQREPGLDRHRCADPGDSDAATGPRAARGRGAAAEAHERHGAGLARAVQDLPGPVQGRCRRAGPFVERPVSSSRTAHQRRGRPVR